MTALATVTLADPTLAAILERARQGEPLSPRDRAQLALALFRAGATLKVVLAACGVKQRDLVKAAKMPAPHVSQILSQPDADWRTMGAKRYGRERTLQLYRAAAKLLHLRLEEIPEAKRLLKEEKNA